MFYTEFDRNHKNGCKRFLEFWRKVSEDKKCIKIINLSDETDLYTLEYGYDELEEDPFYVEYIYLVDNGVTLYFPLLTISDEKVNFDDEILKTNLLKLFKLLNNKKNFKLI